MLSRQAFKHLRIRPTIIVWSVICLEYAAILNLISPNWSFAADQPTSSTSVISTNAHNYNTPETILTNNDSGTIEPAPVTTSSVEKPTKPTEEIIPICNTPAFKAIESVLTVNSLDTINFVINSPEYYVVKNVATLEQAMKAVRKCGATQPHLMGNDAVTTYALTRSFTSEKLPNGNCKLKDVKVGLSVSQLLPQVIFTNNVSSADQSTWQELYSSLLAHENQHKQLSIEHAHKLASSLTNLAGPCSDIISLAIATSKSVTTQLESANNALDE